MTGHEPIIAMRRRGRLPKAGCLWVKTDLQPNREWHHHDDHAEVGIDAADYPELLDLRYAVGLTVIVEGCMADRVAVVGKAFQAHAGRVLTTLFSRTVRPESTRLTDTMGVLSWPK
jgi:hypothetical protein